MNRQTGLVLGTALAFAAGLGLAACSETDAEEVRSAPVAEAQTTQATQPVVTVYKTPT